MDNRIYPAPIVIILYYAFTNTSGAFTWDNIAAIADPVHVKSILLSLKLGFFCTVVCLLLAYPLAMILNSFHFKHQSFVVFLFVLPMWMNFIFAYPCLAAFTLQQRYRKRTVWSLWLWPGENVKYTDRRCIRHGI